MIELGVNIDHVATLRQARGTDYPDPVRAASLAEDAGADLITLHLREDRRHIQDADVYRLRPLIRTRMNLEAAVHPEMLEIALRVKPDDVCLVPERREERTTEGGLDVVGGFDKVAAACRELAAGGIRVSLFIAPDPEQLRASRDAGAAVVELHTGVYADAQTEADRLAELDRVREAASVGAALGLRVNAGHGLHFGNVQAIAAVAQIAELNIGHALVSEAVFMGWQPAIRHMKALMQEARRA